MFPTARGGVTTVVEQQEQDRVQVIDALRGFALIGVVWANTVALVGFNPFLNPALVAAETDRFAHSVLMGLIDGRFMAMYSLLFGIGFGVLASRAAANEPGFVHSYLRRSAALFLIGVTNLVLFGGDVLHTYALFALVLLSVRNASTRTIVVLAVLSLMLPALGRTIVDALGIQRGAADQALMQRLRADGPYLALLQLRLAGLTNRWWVLLNSTNLIGLFLLGLVIARRRILVEPDRYRNLFISVVIVGGLITALGSAAQPSVQAWAAVTAKPWRYLASVFGPVLTTSQMLAYVASFMLLWRWGRARVVLRALIPSGRLALTNYILVNAVVTVGISVSGRFGTVRPALASVMGLVLWLAIVLASRWWIGRFRMGPVEWAWRSLAAGKRQVMTYLGNAPKLKPMTT